MVVHSFVPSTLYARCRITVWTYLVTIRCWAISGGACKSTKLQSRILPLTSFVQYFWAHENSRASELILNRDGQWPRNDTKKTVPVCVFGWLYADAVLCGQVDVWPVHLTECMTGTFKYPRRILYICIRNHRTSTGCSLTDERMIQFGEPTKS